MGGIDPKEALGYTNARLVAKFLGAKKLYPTVFYTKLFGTTGETSSE